MEATTTRMETRARQQEALDKLLRNELAATSTYEQAVEHVEDPALRSTIQQNRESHSARAVMLSQLVHRTGGVPSHRAGPWGTFSKLVEKTASLIGDDAVLKALHGGEKHGTKTYFALLPQLSRDVAKDVQLHGLKEQERTEGRIRELVS